MLRKARCRSPMSFLGGNDYDTTPQEPGKSGLGHARLEKVMGGNGYCRRDINLPIWAD
jgi:hypothetical protein